MTKPLGTPQARKLIQAIRAGGSVVFSRLAREEMAKDKMDAIDVDNVLRGGAVDPGEYENGSWRYRVRTERIVVVIAFRSENELVIVTAWRIK